MKSQQKPKEILLSKRANIFYLEHCKIIQKDERLVILGETGAEVEHYYNLPDRNTMFLLLGIGTSITNSAARRLSESNVIFGFVGNGGSPAFTFSDFVFMPTASEYRPTKYMQDWATIFFNEERRLAVAKKLLEDRLSLVGQYWQSFLSDSEAQQLKQYVSSISASETNEKLLLTEAKIAKNLYKTISQHHGMNGFRRKSRLPENDFDEFSLVNGMIDQGNYIAYGFAAAALHTLGISFAFPILHGKTRRGGLVFDVADLVKDAMVLPKSFEHGMAGSSNQEFREDLMRFMHENQVMDLMMDFVMDSAKVLH
ncbi:type I-F CRISPR-associated endonuclease Cas1f [Hydrogenovibrio halophilus]|uniref:type I-F CRISPR-associated endonuclease Cas1f n=1 Tax=Hydrogenovibrio halophilus TaxID=373391 RepID=UPI000375A5F5|nr:type I-F CRISPR-associated endonuclease Cas1f [Hydrogenovibrio halophilus]